MPNDLQRNQIREFRHNALATDSVTLSSFGVHRVNGLRYHHASPYSGRRVLNSSGLQKATQSYQRIRNSVDNCNHVPVDVDAGNGVPYQL